MTDSSSPTSAPAFIEPKAAKPDVTTCRWHLVSHGAARCDRSTKLRPVSAVILCPKHMRQIAGMTGYVSPEASDRMAERLAEDIVRRKDETIAYLRQWLAEERKPQRKREAPPLDGTIYFLRIGGYVKIGWTSNLEKRMRQYMPDTQLLAVKPGTRKDERQLHRKFAHLKTHGREWFPLAPQITEEIDATVAEHGAPPVVDFSARRAQRIVGPRLTKYIGGDNRGPAHARQRIV